MDTCGLCKRTASVAGLVATALLVVLGLTIDGPAPADAGQLRKYYLTPEETGFQGGQALTACARGFHMASLWEIRDTSNLQYDTARGETQADSGDGPPIELGGWVRTGGAAHASAGAGQGNCDAYTSSSSLSRGTIIYLGDDWTAAPTVISPWQGINRACNTSVRVWCMQD